MIARPRARRPRRGVWLFCAVTLLQWALLAATSMERADNDAREPDSRRSAEERIPDDVARRHGYRIGAQDLRGVTRLRIEGDYDGGGSVDKGQTRYRPKTRVLFVNTPDMWLNVDACKTADDPAGAQRPRLATTRENDTLVLRWSQLPGDSQCIGPPRLIEIELPAQFHDLTLERAAIEARAPLARLQVSGSEIEISGNIDALDLRSTHCPQPDEKQTPAAAAAERQTYAQAALQIDARNMRSIRIRAASGAVTLRGTDAIEKLELHLSDPVSLTMNAALLLDPRRVGAANGRGHAFGAPRAAACTPLRATDPAPGAVALQLLADERR